MPVSINGKIKALSSTKIIEQSGKTLREKPVKLKENALTVLKARYLKKDDDGAVIEEPRDMFLRVAKVVSGAEDLFGNVDMNEPVQTLFYNLMVSGEFMPNSPTLMNAGRELGQLSACFVLPVDDSMDSIFQSVKDAAIIHKSGGGTGFSFSRLRPKNDVVRSTRGISSGPVSFMSVYDAATETIKQGGVRRGANMGILRVDHPDIREFITCKRGKNQFNNFNLSVAVTNDFMEAVKADGVYNLVNPRTGKTAGSEKAREIFDLIVENAHTCGDPGIIFIDRINEHNPLPHLGDIESTNPCGEQPLLPYESCNLGSVNLSLMVNGHEKHKPVIDWERLSHITRLAVRFLDNVIEINKFPLEKIAEETRKNRKIGLGVMGFADMLIKLGVPYDSDEGERIAEQIMEFIDRGKQLTEFHPLFRERAEKEGILNDTLTRSIVESPSLSHIPKIPSSIKRIFRTANDIPVEWHIRIQAAFQRHTDNAVSKTINFPMNAAVQDVKNSYIQAFDAGLKGITIYRYGSRDQQVLTIENTPEKSTGQAGRAHIKPRPRPSVTSGATEKLVTGCGNLYVTVNSDDAGLCEVFCQMGRSGGCTSSQSEAISRLISLALRSGVKLEEIVSQLKGIRCPAPIWHNGKLILSCSDAIATALACYLDSEDNKKNSEIPVFTKNTDSGDLSAIIAGHRLKGEMAGVCPDCGGVLEYAEGCVVCRMCGFTHC